MFFICIRPLGKPSSQTMFVYLSAGYARGLWYNKPMAKKWIVKAKAPEKFLEKYSHPVLAQILYNRGLITDESVDNFLHPQYERMHSPFLFTDMQKSVNRIWQAIDAKEKIVVYSDYDADGVTAVAVLLQTFRYLGVDAGNYIPDRFTEGYGLNLDACKKLKDQEVTLIITVDCGTNSIESAEFCKENGIDLIITDHHEITGSRPDSFALINPKNSDDGYPDNQITGVGVAYKLAVAILSEVDKVKQCFVIPANAGIQKSEMLGVDPDIHQDDREVLNSGSRLGGRDDTEEKSRRYIEHWDKWLLDLVSIGTVADCHSLAGENRIIVKYGLRVMAKTKWPGLRALVSLVKSKVLDTHTIGFLLAPRINAAGRLEHASSALDLLMSESAPEAGELAVTLDHINTRRQDITARLVSEAKEQAELQGDRKILVLSHADWPKGVVGLVAGRLAAELNKPVIVLEQGEEECTGSARSVGNFDIVEALKSTAQHLVKFGGHKQAAGLTVKVTELEAFRSALIQYTEEHLTLEDMENVLELEAELTAGDVTLDMHDIIAELEPFGVGNMKPKFLIRNAVMQTQRIVGSGQKHLQMALGVGDSVIESIAFNMAYICDTIKVGDKIDLAVELIADSWNGFRKVKLRVVDIKKAVSD